MTNDEFEFLKELQHELKTQTTDGQAAPRFWGIEETILVPSPEGYGDPYVFPCDFDSRQTFDEYLKETEEEINELRSKEVIDKKDKDIIDTWDNDIDKDDPEEVVDFVNEHFRKKYMHDEVGWMEERSQISETTGCFLTKRAAIAYLDKNYYHHNNGHTYAMTAWRNPEFEKFLDIFTNIDMDKLKTLIDN